MRLLISIIFTVIAADQFTKTAVIQNQWPHRLNTGGAFSLFSGSVGYTTFAGWTLIILLIAGFWLNRRKNANRTLKTGWALLLGGAVSNTLDRRLHGGVVDFIKISYLPVFNLADTAIVIGLIILVVTFVISTAKVTGR